MLSCSEASLPGSSLMTNEINDDYTGVTERLAYRRQYDDRADFTFYVDHGTKGGGYNVIWFFEQWIAYIANEQRALGSEDVNFHYRFRFPDGTGDAGRGYRSSAIYINKFERDFDGSYLSYRFLKAYPIQINSMPISYDSSELLKCTVSFTYTRYLIDRQNNNSSLSSGFTFNPQNLSANFINQSYNTNLSSVGKVPYNNAYEPNPVP